MALYVCITPECEKDIFEHQMEETVSNFKSRILQDQRTSLFDRYPPPFLKRRFKRQERLIAAEIQIEYTNDIIVVFLRMFVRGGRDYDNFKNDPKGFGEKFFGEYISQNYLKSWIDQNREIEKVIEKEYPSEEESSFLWKILSQDSALHSEEFVFESEEWQKAINDKKLQDRLINIPPSIFNCINNQTGEFAIEEVGTNIKILYRNFPNLKKLFLAGIFYEKSLEEIDQVIEKYKFILSTSLVNENDIIKSSRRSYPVLILADDDIWIQIQKNQEANLALSPEESELLQSVYQMENTDLGKNGFPLFINGRAGSGKSTILQYLFSDYIGFYINERISTIKPPIYLTYSKDLVEKSKVSVLNILVNNYKHSLKNGLVSEKFEEIKDITQYSFMVFRDLLIRIIINAGIDDKFLLPKYIDYREFKQRWKVKFQGDPKAQDNYGPDISWHVIRTYIKGYSTSGYIDEEEYDELPRDEKTVTRETFKAVFQKVWSSWYKLICDQEDERCRFWDDQDIVRFIIDNGIVKSEYPAIFCDEAQDFTRIELEFLFRVSIFSDRKITSQDLNRVPFVFAGDPFQTLNPTGFKWDNIKAAFVQKFIYSLDPRMVYGNPQLHYEELSFNYRSSQNIVKLCNSLQALRSVYFGHRNLEPQTTWQYEEKSRMPVYFNSEEPSVWERIRQYPDLRIIVPCAEGEEPDFVGRDPFLNQYIQVDEMGIPRNVISPLRSKGLEFERVIVYGFGQYCNDPRFFESVQLLNSNASIDDREKMLSYEYYLNQLYVSVSRAQKLLIVVDNSNGLNNFWKFGRDPEFISQAFISNSINFEKWDESIGVLSQGTNDVWLGNIEDQPTTAQRLENEGGDKQDPYILRQAAMIYKAIQQPLKEKQCKALAYVFEGKFEDAGKNFLECEMYNEAVSNFWKAKNFQLLRDIAARNPSVTTNLKVRVANQEKKSQLNTTVILFKDLCDKANNANERLDFVGDHTWPVAIARIMDNLIIDDRVTSKQEWIELSVLLSKLIDLGIIKKSKQVGKVLINSGQFREAIKLYEEINEINSTDYQEAKVKEVEKKFNNLSLEDLRTLDDSEKRIAGKMFLTNGQYLEAAKLFSDIRDSNLIISAADQAFSKDGDKHMLTILEMFFRLLFDQKQFRVALSYMDNNARVNYKSLSFYEYLIKNKEHFFIVFTKEFAVSPILSIAEPIEQIKVSEFLRVNYFENKFSDWKSFIHPLVVGAAMERAGRDIDCLKFYGSYENSFEMNGLLSKEAKKRLGAIKYRQSVREEKERKGDLSARHRQEAEDKVKEIGMSLMSIPEYPSITEYLKFEKPESVYVDNLSTSQAKRAGRPFEKNEPGKKELKQPITVNEVQEKVELEPERVKMAESLHQNVNEFRLFGIEIKISYPKRKVQMTNSEDLSSLILNLNEGNFRNDDVDVQVENDDLRVPGWNLKISDFAKFETFQNLSIEFLKQGIEVRIKF